MGPSLSPVSCEPWLGARGSCRLETGTARPPGSVTGPPLCQSQGGEEVREVLTASSHHVPLPRAQAEGREDAAYFESLSAFVSKVRGERFGWEQARDMTFKDIAKNVEAYHNMLTRRARASEALEPEQKA